MVERTISAERSNHLEVLSPSDAIDRGAEGASDLHREGANSARCPDHEHALAALDTTDVGESLEGRPIWMVIASAQGAESPAELHDSGRPILLAQAGIHSGDSACVIPPFSLSEAMKEEIKVAA